MYYMCMSICLAIEFLLLFITKIFRLKNRILCYNILMYAIDN